MRAIRRSGIHIAEYVTHTAATRLPSRTRHHFINGAIKIPKKEKVIDDVEGATHIAAVDTTGR